MRRAYQQTPPGQRAAERWERAAAWSRTTGRPLPPSMREREATSPAVPLGERDRRNRYARQRDSETLTRRQERRISHKINHLAAARRRRKAAG